MKFTVSVLLVVISVCSYAQERSVLDSVNTIVSSFKYNTKKSEMNPSIIGNKLFFSALKGYDSLAVKKNTKYYDLFVCELDDKNNVSSYRIASDKNSKYHDGSLWYDNVYKRYFISRSNVMLDKSFNHFIQTKKVNELKILIYDENLNLLADSLQLPFLSDLYSVSHPSLNSSGDSLYFSSNMPGGFGASDIYLSTYMNGKWSDPKNLGDSINTKKAELFPYYHKNKELFFSSDRKGGVGGLDIYSSINTNNEYSKAELVENINTKYDDFSLVISENNSFGFFTSNRKGGVGSDDIYSLEIKNLFDTYKAVTIDDNTEDNIASAKLRILSSDNTLVSSLVSDNKGQVKFDLPNRGQFRVLVNKENYNELDTIIDGKISSFTFRLKGEKKLNLLCLDGLTHNRLSDVTIVVNSDSIYKSNSVGEKLIGVTNNGDYKIECSYPLSDIATKLFSASNHSYGVHQDTVYLSPKINISSIYYNFDKSDITQLAEKKLNKIVDILNKNPELGINLSSHTDARGTDIYNMILSEKRAQSASAYLVKSGISYKRIGYKYHGERKLVGEIHKLNRRTEFSFYYLGK